MNFQKHFGSVATAGMILGATVLPDKEAQAQGTINTGPVQLTLNGNVNSMTAPFGGIANNSPFTLTLSYDQPLLMDANSDPNIAEYNGLNGVLTIGSYSTPLLFNTAFFNQSVDAFGGTSVAGSIPGLPEGEVSFSFLDFNNSFGVAYDLPGFLNQIQQNPNLFDQAVFSFAPTPTHLIDGSLDRHIQIQAVPEPSTFALLGLGGAMGYMMLRKPKNKASNANSTSTPASTPGVEP